MPTVRAASKIARVLFLAGLLFAIDASGKRTVCTITVNSPDEQAAFRRYLPKDEYQFVELVERGRPDWLASACRKEVRCDVLVISGHFNGHDFFSDQLTVDEYLPVQEMERVSCSDACPGLFSQLKEVYLFGCTSLSPEGGARDRAELVRSLERSGHGHAEAERRATDILARHAETNRDVMRRVFPNVPAIYGFSNVAPLGPAAAPLLARYFESGGRRSVGGGRPDPRLLQHFSAHHMAVTSGAPGGGAQASYRRDVCEFVDDRITTAEKLRFVHALLDREMAETRMYFDRIEGLVTALDQRDRATQAVQAVLTEIASDGAARERYLAFARDADRADTRARMIRVAGALGWLTPDQERAELGAMVRDLLAGPPITTTDVGVVCRANANGELDRQAASLKAENGAAGRLDRAAVLACLGSAEDRAAVLGALASPRAEDLAIAEMYLHERPLTDAADLRTVAAAIARMPASESQVRALDVFARQHVADPSAIEALVELFARSRSVQVQRAVAGVLVRADSHALAAPEVARVLRERRLSAAGSDDMIDILARRLGQTGLVANEAIEARPVEAATIRSSRVRNAAWERP